MPCNYRANGCNVWMSVHAERNLSYAKIIYIIKKSKFGKDVLKYFKTPGSQIAHKHLRCATRGSGGRGGGAVSHGKGGHG